MADRRNNRVNWDSLVLGIFYIIIAIIAFRDPETSLMSIAVLLGISVILSGIGEITLGSRLNKYYDYDNYNASIFSGVIQIILGIIILADIQTTFMALPYIFAIWFIFTSIMGIVISSPLKIFANGAWTSLLVLNILGIILGVMMINNPMSASLTIITLVGIYFLVLGIRSIIHAFQNYKYY